MLGYINGITSCFFWQIAFVIAGRLDMAEVKKDLVVLKITAEEQRLYHDGGKVSIHRISTMPYLIRRFRSFVSSDRETSSFWESGQHRNLNRKLNIAKPKLEEA